MALPTSRASALRLRQLVRAAAPERVVSLSAGGQALRFTQSSATSGALRSTSNGLKATIFGAYGFVGRYVTALLASGGTQCVIPYRGDDMEWRHLKVNGDLGVVAPMPYSPRDIDSVRRAVEGSDIVINLIGKDYESRHYLPWLVNFSFADMHVRIPEMIAKVAVEQGATCLVHMSALGADSHSLSQWARSKAEGEEAVHAVAPGATIIRPADVFGPEDRFLNLFAQMHLRLPRVPLVEGGAARVQPVFVHDVARAVFKVATSEDPEIMLGQTYDIAGPDEYTYREIVEYVFEQIKTPYPEVANVSPSVAGAIGAALGVLPSPLINADRFLRMQSDVILDDLAPTKRLADLGLEATSMELPGFSFLERYRQGNPEDYVPLGPRHLRKA